MSELQKRFALLSFVFCIAITASAQDPTRKNSIGVYQQFSDYNVRFSENNVFTFDSAFSQSVRVAYQRRLSRTWMLNTGITNGFILNQRLKGSFLTNAYAVGVDASVVFKLNNGRILKENPIVAPFLSFGYRADYVHKLSGLVESPWLLHNQYGAGFNIRLIERTHINIQLALDQKLLGDFNSHMQYRLGLTQSIGKWEETAPKHNPDLDSDGDGIVDISDECPSEFGLASTNGCPVTSSFLQNNIAVDSLNYLLQHQKEVIRKLELEMATVRNKVFMNDTAFMTDEIYKLKLAQATELNNIQVITLVDTPYKISLTDKDAELEEDDLSLINQEIDVKESARIAAESDSLLAKEELTSEEWKSQNLSQSNLNSVESHLYSIESDSDSGVLIPSIPENKNYYVITFSSAEIRNARAWQAKVKADFPETRILRQPNGFHRVGIYAAKDRVLAFRILEKAKKIGYLAWISVE